MRETTKLKIKEVKKLMAEGSNQTDACAAVGLGAGTFSMYKNNVIVRPRKKTNGDKIKVILEVSPEELVDILGHDGWKFLGAEKA